MNKITERILQSKKYKDIYSKTIDRIVGDAIFRYGEKRAEDEAKKTLHQVWGAFYSSRPDFGKLLDKINKLELKDEASVKSIVSELLWIHSSTAERANFIEEFYKKIFEITGKPKSIIDLACGFNPLAVIFMDLDPNTDYKAYDIDAAEIKFLTEIFQVLDTRPRPAFKLGDVLSDSFENSDVVFLLKAIPVLENQIKGSTEVILNNLKCKFLVVSFPLKSLSGKEVGMSKFYSENFEKILGNRNLHHEKLEFENELVYVINQNNE